MCSPTPRVTIRSYYFNRRRDDHRHRSPAGCPAVLPDGPRWSLLLSDLDTGQQQPKTVGLWLTTTRWRHPFQVWLTEVVAALTETVTVYYAGRGGGWGREVGETGRGDRPPGRYAYYYAKRRTGSSPKPLTQWLRTRMRLTSTRPLSLFSARPLIIPLPPFWRLFRRQPLSAILAGYRRNLKAATS